MVTITTADESTRAAWRRQVLAISPRSAQLRTMVASLERAGADVHAVRSIGELTGDHLTYRYVFVALQEDLSPLARLAERLGPRCHVACIRDSARLPELTAMLRDDRVNHVIVGDQLEPGVFVTARKLLTGDIFGIEKYLPAETPINYIRLRDFRGRGQAVDRIVAFAERVKMRRSTRTAIAQVCEELLMNALYDAPVDDDGRQLFAEIAPQQRTTTRSPRPVSIRYAATETQFVVAVRDRFGRLAKPTILNYIDKCLTASDQIERKAHGAGLGIYLVANAAAGYVVNVAEGIATEVVCTFDRQRRTPLRLLGIFSHPGLAEPNQGELGLPPLEHNRNRGPE
jgi:hypothetical protein